jgi:hypothetical protein
MDFEDIVRKAETDVGHRSADSGAALHLDGFKKLYEGVCADRELSDSGAIRAKQALFERIRAYLIFQRDFERYPEIRSTQIHRPLFILDSGRTGSTLLQALLALDEQARTPRRWELVAPSPPPRPETYASDQRIELVAKSLRNLASLVPDILKAHPIAADSADECHWMMSHGTHNFVYYRYPGYWQWFSSLGDRQLLALYQQYRRQVQHLTVFMSGGHWLSKSPVHRQFSSVLPAVFPDFTAVRLHRRPTQCIPSLASLIAKVRSLSYPAVNKAEIGQDVLTHFVEGVRRMMQVDTPERSGRFVDLSYEDLVADPVGSIAAIYAQLDYDFTDRFRRAIRQYLVGVEAAPAFAHRYTFEEYGLSRDTIEASCAGYIAWANKKGVRLAA